MMKNKIACIGCPSNGKGCQIVGRPLSDGYCGARLRLASQIHQEYVDWFKGKILALTTLGPNEIANVLGHFDDFTTICTVADAQLARDKERLLAALA
jgi:hypothetical protein